MKKIKIGNKLIGEGEPCFIVAEAGSNHDGKLNQAKELIDIAAEAGADAIKFQTFHPTDIVHPKIESKIYGNKTGPKYWVKVLNNLTLNKEWYPELFAYAEKNNLIFLSTPSCVECARFLFDLGVSAFKIASMDLTYLEFLKEISKLGKPIILSTGMGTLAEIEDAVDNIKNAGLNEVVLMHCVSNYPAIPRELNLLNIKTLQTTFGLPIGFSDHSLGITSSIVAVALGACVIEKHLTINRNLKGPDHRFSLEPIEFKKLVKEIRIAQESLGTYQRTLSEAEKKKRVLYRRSIIARKNIVKGKIIKRDDLIVTRPGSGIPPRFINTIVGASAKRNIVAYEPIQWEDVL